MRPNPLRQRLQAGLPTLGTHTLSCWPTLVELVAQAGNYHYVEFSGEYAPFTTHDLDNLGRVYELTGLAGMIKVEQTQWTHQAMRAIGSGFQGVLFADLRSVDDARACVAAVRAETILPTRGRGLLGVGMRRDVGTVREAGLPSYVEGLDQIVVALMIEKREAMECLDALLEVPGIDMLQFGPADFAMSIGHPGAFTHPDVVAAERTMIQKALARGLHPRAEIREPAQAKPYWEMGVKDFCMGWDVSILHDYWRGRGETMAEMFAGDAPRGPATERPTGNYR